MKIFNPNENTKIDKLKKENEELRNTLHNVLTRQGDFEDLESKSESMKIRVSDLAKEELRIEEYLKTTIGKNIKRRYYNKILNDFLFSYNKQHLS